MCNAIIFQQGEPQTGLSQRDQHVFLSLNWVNVTLLTPDVLQYPTTVSSALWQIEDRMTPIPTQKQHLHMHTAEMETYLRLFPQGPQGGAPLPLHFYHHLPTAPVMAWLDPAEKNRWYRQGIFQMSFFPLIFEAPNQNFPYPNINSSVLGSAQRKSDIGNLRSDVFCHVNKSEVHCWISHWHMKQLEFLTEGGFVKTFNVTVFSLWLRNSV